MSQGELEAGCEPWFMLLAVSILSGHSGAERWGLHLISFPRS